MTLSDTSYHLLMMPDTSCNFLIFFHFLTFIYTFSSNLDTFYTTSNCLIIHVTSLTLDDTGLYWLPVVDTVWLSLTVTVTDSYWLPLADTDWMTLTASVQNWLPVPEPAVITDNPAA